MFGNDNRSALMSSVLSVDPEDAGARETVDWMRANLPGAAGPAADVDVGGPTALIKDFDDRVVDHPAAGVRVRRTDRLRDAVDLDQVGVPCAQGRTDDGAVGGRRLRKPGRGLRVGLVRGAGLQATRSLDSTIPPLVLAMTFGLSMDYEIFLLTRIRERFLQTNNTRDAVAYGVSTSARTITSAALIMIAVFIGFAFAGMPLVAQLGVACAVAIAVDATVVRLVLVPALMAMFAQWNWWLPRLAGPRPAVGGLREAAAQGRHRRPRHHPRGHLHARPVGLGHPHRRASSAAKLKTLAPQTITVADPLAFSGCRRRARRSAAHVKGGDEPLVKLRPLGRGNKVNAPRNGARQPGRTAPTAPRRQRIERSNGSTRPTVEPHPKAAPADPPGHRVARPARRSARRPVHRGRDDPPVVRRLSPMETTNVQLPTGDRLQIPTGAETLRLKSYLIMCRNSARDYAEFAESGRVHGHSNGSGGPGRNGPVLLWTAVEKTMGGHATGTATGRPAPVGRARRLDIGTRSGRRLGTSQATLPVGGSSNAGGGEVTLTTDAHSGAANHPQATQQSAARRPQVDQRPVEFWPTSSIRSALETDDLTTWQRIVTAIKRDPYGRTARQVEEVLETAPPVRRFEGHGRAVRRQYSRKNQRGSETLAPQYCANCSLLP